MTNILNVFTSNRFKSFYWRTGMMILATFIDFTIANLADFQLDPQYTILLGLGLGELSKYLNSKK